MSTEEETIMEQLVKRFGMLVGVLAAISVLTLTPGGGLLGADAQDGAAVTIVDFAFQPASLEVPAGSTVTWTNSGAATHTVTDDSAGTFTYHCEIHPQMVGTIVVMEASSTQAAAPAQGTEQPTADKQDTSPKTVQMPNTGVGTMALAGRTTLFALFTGLGAVGLGASAVLIRRRA
jgi:plastocyanin